jgi:hypothetical protein
MHQDLPVQKPSFVKATSRVRNALQVSCAETLRKESSETPERAWPSTRALSSVFFHVSWL